MGSFVGHVIPGTFFLLYAVWWTFQILRHYFRSLRRDAVSPYVNKVIYPLNLPSGRCSINLDAWVIVALTSAGIIVEVVAAPLFRGTHVVGSTNTQHATMYLFFGALGAFSILLSRVPLLPHRLEIEYVLLILAFSVEAILFKFHLFGREGTNVLLHVLLVYCIYGCIFASILEMRYRHNVIFALLRAYFTLLQGTWFWQVAVYLYRPGVDAWGRLGHHDDHDSHGNGTEEAPHEQHETMMLYTCSFAWHLGAVLAFMMVVAVFLFQYNRRKGLADDVMTSYPMTNLRKSEVRYTRVNELDEDGDGMTMT